MSQHEEFRDYYDILEVPPEASHQDIISAYHRAKETYDVDSPALYTMFTKEEAAELRALVEEAFLILSNHTKRKEYDENFRGIGSTESLATTSNTNSESTNDEDQPEKTEVRVPDGYRKGTFGVYELKQSMEEEIETRTDFDGDFFKRVREYQKVTLEQISKQTRISRSYINAVETNDYSALPAPVFVRGFIIQLCKMLGLESEKVTASYMDKFNTRE